LVEEFSPAKELFLRGANPFWLILFLFEILKSPWYKPRSRFLLDFEEELKSLSWLLKKFFEPRFEVVLELIINLGFFADVVFP
jgi:hypothetical protein